MQLLKSNFFWLANLNRQQANDAYISSLDPLGVDELIRRLPEQNKNKDVRAIIQDLYANLPYPQVLEDFTYAEAIACMRDLGMYIGSIKRHGPEPVEAVPELDYILDVLGSKTDMPPRDTLLHYTMWNPSGERQRKYTSYPDEEELIQSVRISMFPLLQGIYYLIELSHKQLKDPQFEILCQLAGEQFRNFIDGIVLAKRKVSPMLFAKELRLYFDPITLYNREYIGPGAVEMPLFVYDHILWGSDIDDEEFRQFSKAYVPYNLPTIRDIYYHFSDQPSLISKACEQLQATTPDRQTIDSAKALHRLCKLGRSFRVPHKKLADESYKHESAAQRERGSGGYSTSILEKTLELNTQQYERLGQQIIDRIL